MPVRSLRSSVLKWPSRDEIDKAVRQWALKQAGKHPESLQIGYFGSYARDDWGVGSDLGLVAVVNDASEPFERRNLSWDMSSLPVPADLLVYTEKEWKSLQEKGGRFPSTLSQETMWVYKAKDSST
jgi:predicted nucleotidyltransferase